MRAIERRVLILLPLLVWSCGKSTNGAPNGSTITLQPTGIDWTYNGPAAGGCVWSTPHSVDITVKNASGTPLNNTTISVFADPTYIQLFDDTNNNGVLDPSENIPVSGNLVTKTESFGSKFIFVSAQGGGTGCSLSSGTGNVAYSIDVSVYSGGAYAISTQTMK